MSGGTVEISCGECRLNNTDACDDCVVSFLLERGDQAVIIDVAEARAVRMLQEVGLVPALRHDRRAV